MSYSSVAPMAVYSLYAGITIEAEGRVWCDVQELGGGPRGYVAAEFLTPAISPDGETVVFSYRGDLWSAPTAGGTATPLTLHEAHDSYPVWSRDGSTIAFASDRYGNYDVFVMDADGGVATRLTFHSANDLPTSFTPDGRSVLFGSARLDAASCVQFPTGAQPEAIELRERPARTVSGSWSPL